MTALISRDDRTLAITFTSTAEQLRTEALEFAALIGRVSDPIENQKAVEAQIALKGQINLVEDARVACKGPVLDFGRKIDNAVKEYKAPMEAELIRVSRLVGDYQQLQIAKAKAEEAARVQAQNEIDRRAQEQIAKATSHEEIEKIQERRCEEAAALPVVAQVRAKGQVVSEEIDYEVTDIWLLARSHPTCVTVTDRRSEVKSLLKAGVVVAGVRVRKEIKAGVRVPAGAIVNV